MLFGCFGQKKSTDYEKKEKSFTKKTLAHNWEEPAKIKELIQPCLVAHYGGKTKVGSSKFGGTPDLPNGMTWPEFEGHPMVFFAQLNLREIAELYENSDLPKKGMLYFFSYFENPDNEFGAYYEFLKAKSEYQVFYSEKEDSELVTTAFPTHLSKAYHFKATPIQFDLQFQVPPTTETWFYENANLNEKDTRIYEELLDPETCEEDMMLGVPCPIQYGADYDWAYSYTDITDFNDPEQLKKVNQIRPQFINLFSFTMVNRFEAIGLSNCYFGITKEDLKNKNFDKIIFILQDS